MRRTLLLATLLALPALAHGQSLPVPPAGGLSFGTDLHSAVDGYINAAECAGGTLVVRWDVENAGTNATPPTSFKVYAHNSTNNHNESSTGLCPTVDGDGSDTALKAGEVGSFTVSEANPNQTGAIPVNLPASVDIELAASTIVAVSGKSCTPAEDVGIILCVQANNNAGTARGKVTLSTQPPAAPTGVVAGSGSGALNIDWTATTGTPAAEYYVIEAGFAQMTALTPGLDPADVPTVTSDKLTATSYRLTGLIDGVVYKVWVYGYSSADNRSVHSAEVRAMPELAKDFWNAYDDAGGREQGGCGAGTAGPLGLLIAAAAIAFRRRRS